MSSRIMESLSRKPLFGALPFKALLVMPALITACSGNVPQTQAAEHPAIAEARKSSDLSGLLEQMRRAGWEVPTLDGAEVETFKAPISEGSAVEVESTRVVLHANRSTESGETVAQVDVYFAPGADSEHALALDPKTEESTALLENESFMALSDAGEMKEPSTDQSLEQALSAAACGKEGGACPCCAGLYCGYNNSSNLHCYCQRTSWTCRYTSSWGSGSGSCRSRDNPGGIYHTITWRTGCQKGTAWYADWKGNGIICPDPQTAAGGYPVCGRPK